MALLHVCAAAVWRQESVASSHLSFEQGTLSLQLMAVPAPQQVDLQLASLFGFAMRQFAQGLPGWLLRHTSEPLQ